MGDCRHIFGTGKKHLTKLMNLFEEHGLTIGIPSILTNQSTKWTWKTKVGTDALRYGAQQSMRTFGQEPICEEYYDRVALIRLHASCHVVND